jgi:TrpR-related protein YerC/YecD
MKNTWNTKQIDELFQAILELKNLDEARNYFRDLLTEEELKEFASRWKVARMLDQKVPYTKIKKETGMSSTTIARVSKWLNDGMNGYKLLIKRVNSSHHTSAHAG